MAGIYGAFKEWESQTCLQFVPRTTEPDYVEFFGSGGGWVETALFSFSFFWIILSLPDEFAAKFFSNVAIVTSLY
jgi:hypothetical protein